MYSIRFLIVLILGILMFESTYAQRSSKGKGSHTRTRHNSGVPKVRGTKAKIICPIFEHSKYPYHGIGFKVGDPFAITYKFYATKRFAFALDVGKAASGLYNRYFREKFSIYAQSDTFSTRRASLVYLSHKVNLDLVGEAKFLYHLDAKKMAPGLQAYIGAGWEWKHTKLQYDYLYNRDFDENQFQQFSKTRFAMGPQFVVGIEYAYFQIPISAFMELEHFIDVQADPGWQRFEGGVGLRYIF